MTPANAPIHTPANAGTAPLSHLASARHPAQQPGRVPLDKSGPVESLVSWVARRMFGTVPDPVKVAFHHRRILLSYLRLELAAKRWKKLPPTLNALAVMATAQEIGCSWCLDFGYWEHHHRGVDAEKLTQVPQWRDSEVYTPVERAVMAYAVAATATPPVVTDEMVATLRETLDDAQLVELTTLVSLENFRSRTNAAMGLSSQGFKAECEIPVGNTGR